MKRTLRTPTLVAIGWSVATAPGTRLFFVGGHGLNIGGVTGAGQVYVFKVN